MNIDLGSLDLDAILTFARTASPGAITALFFIVLLAIMFLGWKAAGLGAQVVTLLGNHIRHDLADQRRVIEQQTEVLTDQTRQLEHLSAAAVEQTAVLHAIRRAVERRIDAVERAGDDKRLVSGPQP